MARPLDSDAAGSCIFPTVVYVDDNRKIWACRDAQRMGKQDPKHFRREFKPDIYDGIAPGLGVTCMQLVAEVLKTMKKAAEKALGKPVENAVLTIPASYHESDVKTEVMKQAAKEAGFRQTEIQLREPEAAAIYYDFLEKKSEGYTLVYDLGGGTFDAALIKHKDSNYKLAGSNGSDEIGGKFFTELILKDYLKRNGKTQRDATDDDVQKCEDIKRHLSDHDDYPAINGKACTRGEFENMISGSLNRTVELCEKLVRQEAKLEWKDINRILLIGGSCQIPLVQTTIRRYLESMGIDGVRIVFGETESGKVIDPQFAVALGAAVYAMKKYMTPPPALSIGMLKDLATGKTCPLKEGTNTFGRSDLSDFVFPDDAKMSRRHFSIEVTKTGNKYEYLISDLKSARGTVVGRMCLSYEYSHSYHSVSIVGGERIVAGNTKFEFII